MIDDSLVRGTTSVKIIKMLYEAGAKEIHLRIASPPIKYPDYYGVDTPDKDELLASKLDIEGMRKFINATTLKFLSVDGLYKSMGYEKKEFIISSVHRSLFHRRLPCQTNRRQQ